MSHSSSYPDHNLHPGIFQTEYFTTDFSSLGGNLGILSDSNYYYAPPLIGGGIKR